MQQNRLSNAVGLCMRSGRLKSGELAVEQAIGKKQAKLVLLDTMVSDATEERYVNRCAAQGLQIVRMDGLGDAIGKSARMVAAVVDDGFARMILREAAQDTKK